MNCMVFTVLQSKLELKDLKAHYGSYIAAGHISVYNPVSVMSALAQTYISNFWVATGLTAMVILFNQLKNTIGAIPPLSREVLNNSHDIVEALLAGAEIEFVLMESVSHFKGHMVAGTCCAA